MKKYKMRTILSALGIAVVAAAFIFNLTGNSADTGSQIFEHPAVQNPEVAGRRVVQRIELLDPKAAFNFDLTNMDNASIQLKDFEGKLVLVGFIYTTCPDVCGILTQHFRLVQRKFKDIIDKDLVLVLITTDPERDTPERVAAYTKGFNGRWYFLTGSKSQLEEVWEQYHVFVQEKREADLVYHTYMVALIDREGFIRYRYVGLVDPEEVIVTDIQHLLSNPNSQEIPSAAKP